MILILIAFTVRQPSFWVYGDHKLCENIDLKTARDKNYSVEFDSTRTLIAIKGTLEIGIFNAVANSLKKFPHTTGIVLDSTGGNVYQARGIA